MQCSSPMPFITTYVGFNYCRSISGNAVHYKLFVNLKRDWYKIRNNKAVCSRQTVINLQSLLCASPAKLIFYDMHSSNSMLPSESSHSPILSPNCPIITKKNPAKSPQPAVSQNTSKSICPHICITITAADAKIPIAPIMVVTMPTTAQITAINLPTSFNAPASNIPAALRGSVIITSKTLSTAIILIILVTVSDSLYKPVRLIFRHRTCVCVIHSCCDNGIYHIDCLCSLILFKNKKENIKHFP